MTNEDFEKLSAAEKRVAIARDVIAALDSKKIRAMAGVYLAKDTYTRGDEDCAVTPETLNPGKCTACAIGSLFMCQVQAGRVELQSAWTSYAAWTSYGAGHGYFSSGRMRDEVLSRYFTGEQLGLIESAFERSGSFAYDDALCEWEEAQKAVAFGVRFGGNPDDDTGEAEELLNDEARLRAIMTNIIENNGEFRP